MKHLSFRFILLGIAFFTLLVCSVGFSDDFSDFEKLFQEAVTTTKDAAAAESKSSAASKTDLAPPRNLNALETKKPAAVKAEAKEIASPNPGAAIRSMTTKPVAPKVAQQEIASDGWTTIKPNAPGIVVPEPKVVTPPAQPAITQPAIKETQPSPFVEADKIEEPAKLVEPQPVATNDVAVIEEEQSPAATTESTPITESAPSESLIPDGLFDETKETLKESEFDIKIEVIEEEADVIESDGDVGTRRVFRRVQESDANSESKPEEPKTEPAKTEPKKPDAADVPKDALSAKLDDLANEKTDESKAEPAKKDKAKPETKKEETSKTSPEAASPEKTQVTVTIPDFDSDDDETVWKMIDPSLVGDPHVTDKLKLMYEEVLNGLRTRNITNRYEMWKSYARKSLRDTAGINTGSELDGRGRLSWYQKLYDKQVQSVFDAEEYSRELFVGLSGGHRHLAELMPGIRERMDVLKREDSGIRFPLVATPLEALNEVKRCLLIASAAHARAFSTLTSAELTELDKNFVNTFVGNGCVNGHTIPARSVGRKHVDILEKIDKAALYDAGEALIPLTNTALLDLLVKLPENALPQVAMNGQKFQRLSTAAGDIIIGGRGKNMYDLDSPEMREVICVIGLGEEDIYREGTCDMDRPVMTILALGKQNTFVGTKPGIQGGSIMGVSMLLDRGGNSTYSARDVAQGSTMGGIGILINYSGNNTYTAMRRAQGHALLGLGMLIDKGTGNASYKASLWSQGFGAPSGYGILSNSAGNNHYYCGGLYPDSYPEHPGYDGWGQGVGAGIRQVANGGIGVILSGKGNDVYEVDYFGQGGGYWLGVGISRDFGGNDLRHGTTLKTYDGRPRVPGNGTQSKWTRFVNGFGCHYALGFCFDDGGNDTYGGMIMGTGMAWDLSIGMLCDFAGSGTYTATGSMTQGVGAEGSIGVLFSYGGNDQFASRSQGHASPSVTYHPAACGGNFSFLINYGGEDKYGSRAANNTYVQRGTPSGFIIDRPTEKEAAANLITLRKAIEDRNKEIAEFDARVAELKEEYAARGRRYVERRRRPQPISEEQQTRLSAVPDFSTEVLKAEVDTPAAK